MKNITKLLILGFIVFISCKTRNDSKIIPATTDIKAGIPDTTILSKSVRDNYLIDNTSNQDNGPVYMFCEKMPEFPGGESAFTAYLKNKIKYSKFLCRKTFYNLFIVTIVMTSVLPVESIGGIFHQFTLEDLFHINASLLYAKIIIQSIYKQVELLEMTAN